MRLSWESRNRQVTQDPGFTYVCGAFPVWRVHSASYFQSVALKVRTTVIELCRMIGRWLWKVCDCIYMVEFLWFWEESVLLVIEVIVIVSSKDLFMFTVVVEVNLNSNSGDMPSSQCHGKLLQRWDNSNITSHFNMEKIAGCSQNTDI